MSKCADCAIHKGQFVTLKNDKCPQCGATYPPQVDHGVAPAIPFRKTTSRRRKGNW